MCNRPKLPSANTTRQYPNWMSKCACFCGVGSQPKMHNKRRPAPIMRLCARTSPNPPPSCTWESRRIWLYQPCKGLLGTHRRIGGRRALQFLRACRRSLLPFIRLRRKMVLETIRTFVNSRYKSKFRGQFSS